MTENQKRILKRIGKFTVYTAVTGGAYFLARGAIGLLLRKLEAKTEARMGAQHGKIDPPATQAPSQIEESKTPFAAR